MKMFRTEVKTEIDRTEKARRIVGGNRASGPDPADDANSTG